MCYKIEKQKKDMLKLQEKMNGVPEFIQNYFVFLTSSTSRLSYWSYIRQLLEWLISNKTIKHDIYNITPEDLNKIEDIHIINYLDGLKLGMNDKKNSLSSIETKKNVFSGFWNYLLNKGYVNKNIVSSIPKEKYKTKGLRYVDVPTELEVEEFLNNLSNIKSKIISLRNIAITKLFIGSAIRLEELVGLDVSDLHVDKDGVMCVWVMGKGNQDEDAMVGVPISNVAYKAVIDYLELRNADPELVSLKPLFVSERVNQSDRRLSPSMIQDFFSEYSNKRLHPHLMRHYAGTMLYRNTNHDIELVRGQLRHGNINTTTKFYVNNDKTDTVAALNTF